jgi:hypothetical protein
MVDQFKQITHDPNFKGWTLIGNNRLVNGGNAHSCASLAYSLLRTGGIHRLVSTPDELAKFSLSAKKFELLSYPEIKNFSFKRTYKVSIVDPQLGHRYIEGTEIESDTVPKNCCSLPKNSCLFFRKHPYLTIGMSITAAAMGIYCKMT